MPNSNNTPPVMRGGAEVKFEPLQNKAAIAFFKRKVPGLTQAWDDWIAPMHSHSFTIAGGMSIDFLTDMQGAIAKALETGTGYREYVNGDIVVPDQKERPDKFLEDLEENPVLVDLNN